MDEKTKKIQNERTKLFEDYYDNIIPERMPVAFNFALHQIETYGNVSMIDGQYDYTKLHEPARKMAKEIYSDTCPISGVNKDSRVAGFYQTIDSQSFKMGSSGYVQHPEVMVMQETEYGELIKDPYKFCVDTVIPRQHKGLSLDKPVLMAKKLLMAKSYLNDSAEEMGGVIKELIEQEGYYPGQPKGSGGFTAAPFDFLSDQLRSFSKMPRDIRRHKTEVLEACEALLPLMFKYGLPQNPVPTGSIMTPLHMPTFLKEKETATFWNPTFKKMVQEFHARGARVLAFCEDNWMRYIDMMQDWPAGMILRFEYGDPKLIADKLAGKFLIQGLYPLSLIKTGTKQQCIDKAKALLDIMMPTGSYLFSFDKGPILLSDMNLENYRALSEFVRDYAVYKNAGDTFGTKLNAEGFIPDPAFDSPI
ncbi:MAG: uroporphyrinogen decarboxylase family protein, partial [Eubacterium sp.]